MTINLKEREAAEVPSQKWEQPNTGYFPDIFDTCLLPFYIVMESHTNVNIRTQLCNSDFFTADVILHCMTKERIVV
jgi:hypothetical protein